MRSYTASRFGRGACRSVIMTFLLLCGLRASLGDSLPNSNLGSGHVYTTNGSGNLIDGGVLPAAGSGAEQTISFQPGLLTAVTNTKGVFGKFVKASTVDNIIASAINFTCVGNPTITLYECGTDVNCATSPVSIGTATVTAAGAAVTGTVSTPAIAAGDFVAWAISAGTCTSIDISATAQVHAN